jgi:hypothetical protein
MWQGKAFHRLGVQHVTVLIFIGVLFLPSVVLAPQQGFEVMELMQSASTP